MTEKSLNFIEEIVTTDKSNGTVPHLRFPPEPNGYLHIGHAKSMCLNFGLGDANLRFDDTNPSTEDPEYVEAIQDDIAWMGFEPDNVCYASNYFDHFYAVAIKLIKSGHAYVCLMSPEEFDAAKGTPTIPGTESPNRNLDPERNLDLFAAMKNGLYKEGEATLRAKIDMTSSNMHMRDPILYRIKHANHYRTGDEWCIYPMYDFAHCLSDEVENITHSLCTLEFEVHRPLYEWILNAIEIESPPRQIEFARLNMSYTIMSKRHLATLVNDGHVNGWDDPRLPTISGLRRRGYTPESIRNFCERIGIARRNALTDIALLEFSAREHLNKIAPRYMAVLDPIKVTISNYDGEEMMTATNNPEDESAGTREIAFTKVIYIERSDFMEEAPKKFFRLSPGKEVRLRYAYYITCTGVIKDTRGNITELICTYDPESKGGKTPDGRRVKGTIHWVSATHGKNAEVRLYDRLFTEEEPGKNHDGDYIKDINPESLKVTNAKIEPSLTELLPGDTVQFERTGYFCVDPDTTSESTIFNRTVALRDSWSKRK